MANEEYDRLLKKFLIPLLRRKSLWWPARQEAKRDARIERGFYRCEICKNPFSGKEIELDHRIPVINVKTSFTTWDDFIKSLYCDKSNFSVLCRGCHTIKSSVENEQRQMNRNKKKSRKKKKKLD